jgi:hypothetical protein
MSLSSNAVLQTPHGAKRASDLKMGDHIFNSGGQINNVLSIVNEGFKPCYRVKFSDSTYVDTDLSQKFKVRIYTATIEGIRKEFFKLLSLEDIIKREFKMPSGAFKHVNVMNSAVIYPEKSVYIHPYILGILLGDGHLKGSSPYFSLCNSETEILSFIEDKLPKNIELSLKQYPGCWRVSLIEPSVHKQNKMKDAIKQLGLDVKGDKKFLPDIYKYNSVENRIELLKGLMDSDGHAQLIDGTARFYTSNEKLATDVIELVNSLGGIVYKYESKRGDKVKPATEFTLVLRLNFNPFKLSTKNKNWRPMKRTRINKTIISASYIGEKEVISFNINGGDNSFLADNFIVVSGDAQ